MSPLNLVLAALRDLGIRHALGGSVASGVRGVLRATFDADLIALIRPAMVDRLLARLGKDWYGDGDGIRRMLEAGRAFNVIHIPSSLKIDVFPARSEFHEVQLERASIETFDFMGEAVECPVTAAEDIVLAKLRWYRDGGEVSERQWSDITNVIAVQESMDEEYLEQWAARLGVADLLERARQDAALG